MARDPEAAWAGGGDSLEKGMGSCVMVGAGEGGSNLLQLFIKDSPRGPVKTQISGPSCRGLRF